MATTVPKEEVAEAYEVDLARIEAAVEFEEQLARRLILLFDENFAPRIVNAFRM